MGCMMWELTWIVEGRRGEEIAAGKRWRWKVSEQGWVAVAWWRAGDCSGQVSEAEGFELPQLHFFLCGKV